MKKILFALATMATLIGNANAQTKWNLDAAHSSIKFSVSHLMISETEGKFTKFEGTVTTPNAKDVSGAKIDFTVDVNSINTDNEGRDKHLKNADFFDVEKYPNMKFVSKTFKKVKGNNYMLEGDMTIHGVTKTMKIPVKFGGIANDPWGNTKAGFKAQFVIDRSAFGISGSKPAVGNEVNVTLNMELAQAK